MITDYIRLVFLSLGMLFGILTLGGAPVQGEEMYALPEHRDLLSLMEDARENSAYTVAMKQLRELPEYRRFVLGKRTTPEAIPLEKLSAEDARKGYSWYTGCTAEVCITPQTVAYYNQVLFPALRDFYSKVATKVNSKRCSLPVYADKGNLYVSTADTANKLARGLGFVVYLCRTEQTDFSKLKAGDMLDCEIYVFGVPPVYKYAVNYDPKGHSWERPSGKTYNSVHVRLSVENAAGKEVLHNTDYVYVGEASCENRNSHTIVGFGAGVNKHGDVRVRTQAVFSRFSASGVKHEPGELSFDMSLLNPAELKQQDEARVAAERAERKKPGFFLYLIASIIFGAWATCPLMIYILVKERQRRHIAIPLPEGWDASMYNRENLHPVCAEYIALVEELALREVNGVQYRVFSERSEVDRGYAWLAKAVALENKNADTIYFINLCGQELNEAQKRHLVGSKLALAGCLAVFLLFAFPFLSEELWLWFFWSGLGFVYYLSVLIPAYKIANEEPKYIRVLKSIIGALGIGGFFAATEMASGKYATVYGDNRGNAYVDTEDLKVGCFLSCLLYIVLLFIAPILLSANGICNFIRNYLQPR